MIKRAKPSPKQIAAREAKKLETKRLLDMYQEIWDERPHKSEISGKWLGNEIKTTFFHHILPKSTCSQLKFSKTNIALITTEEHLILESPKKEETFPKINKRRDELLLSLLSGAGIITKIDK